MGRGYRIEGTVFVGRGKGGVGDASTERMIALGSYPIVRLRGSDMDNMGQRKNKSSEGLTLGTKP